MRLVLSSFVASDLEQIADYIARDSPLHAMRTLRQLHARMKKIARRPQLYRLRPDIAPGIRIAVLGVYIILFQIRENTVRVERVIHGNRDLLSVLSEIQEP